MQTMQITKITVTLGRTINMGNYNSARIETGAEASLNAVERNSTEHVKAVRLLTSAVDKSLDAIQGQLGLTSDRG